jgi:PadR family transcriptional regulator PadR
MFGMEHRDIDKDKVCETVTDTVSPFIDKIARELKSGLYSVLILVSIGHLKRPTYGYEIIKTIEKLSDGAFRLKDATVYPVLKDLEKRGLVKGFWGEPENGHVRRYYELTEDGREALSRAVDELERESSAANRIIGAWKK